jgi:catechol 2,3-dioxygenase-like lactoylglutathione lyase family enzyme
MAVTGLSQIHVSVDDIDAAVTFYRDVLGLRFLFDVPEQSMAFFDMDGTRLYLGKPESPDFRSAPLLYFRVDDIDAEFGRLKALDVEFIDEPHKVHESEGYELWMAFFKTPNGDLNAITEERPG